MIIAVRRFVPDKLSTCSSDGIQQEVNTAESSRYNFSQETDSRLVSFLKDSRRNDSHLETAE